MLKESTYNHTTKPMNILLIDDNPTDLLLTQSHVEKISNVSITTADSIAAGLELIEQKTFDAVLLDLCLPDATSLEGLLKLRRVIPTMPIVVLTGINDEELGIMALQRGAQDYLVKGKENNRIAQALQFAIERKRVAANLISEQKNQTESNKHPQNESINLPKGNHVLTEREFQVMKLLGKGNNNQEIASALNLSIATVKTHISNILQKLNVADRTKAVVEALRTGLI